MSAYAPGVRYDADRAAAFYDDYGEREWTRFADGRTSAISLAVHAHYLRRFIHSGDRVLDAGAGPGRFTIELARIGARVVVADLSATQLELGKAKVAEVGLADAVDAWVQADILDLHPFDDGEFDAVVCYGGPLSYVLDRADEALDELLRVIRPNGLLLLSVMSLVGSTAAGLPAVIDQARSHGSDAVTTVVETGDLPSALSGGHLPMHMYRWSELEGLLRRLRCEIMAASASGLAFGRLHHELLGGLTEAEREMVTRWAIDLGAEQGAIDMGEHIIAVVRKPT